MTLSPHGRRIRWRNMILLKKVIVVQALVIVFLIAICVIFVQILLSSKRIVLSVINYDTPLSELNHSLLNTFSDQTEKISLKAPGMSYSSSTTLKKDDKDQKEDENLFETQVPQKGAELLDNSNKKEEDEDVNVGNLDYLVRGYKKTMTTYFWVGEEASKDNDFVSNLYSSWDTDWLTSYGGVDEPFNRCGYYPCSFIPKENPFYFALPYNDLNNDGSQKESIKNIPWYEENISGFSMLKNRWIEVSYKKNVCYGQWEDVGPGESDDFDYVFGDADPKNTFGVKAGLDISPAFWDCLGLLGNDYTLWRFVDYEDVPPGPWKEIVTSSTPSW